MHPSFMTFEALSEGREVLVFTRMITILAFNIMGEEFLWQCVLYTPP